MGGHARTMQFYNNYAAGGMNNSPQNKSPCDKLYRPYDMNQEYSRTLQAIKVESGLNHSAYMWRHCTEPLNYTVNKTPPREHQQSPTHKDKAKNDREKRKSVGGVDVKNMTGPLACDKCPYRCADDNDLSDHKKKHNTEWHKCPMCSTTMLSLYDLEVHMQGRHSDGFKCNQCDRTYKSKSGLQSHISSVHMGQGYKCEHCGNVYNNKPAYDSHLMYDHDDQINQIVITPKE